MASAGPYVRPRLGDAPKLPCILAFLTGIGLPCRAVSRNQATVVPGMTVVGGRLLHDPQARGWPSDLLHEAGHLALTDPADIASHHP